MAIKSKKAIKISQKHLLGIQDLSINDLNIILNEASKIIDALNIKLKITTQNEGENYSILLGPIENNDANKLDSSFISKGYKKTEIIIE